MAVAHEFVEAWAFTRFAQGDVQLFALAVKVWRVPFSKTTYKTVKQKNGIKKKKKVRSKVDSDWREYYGSSPELSKDVTSLGTENFTREILFYCDSKSACSYIEAREQFSRKVLESTDYYNGHIQVRVHGSHIINKI